MLALADRNGEVQGSVPGLARLSGVSLEACDAALAKLLAPDGRSRTKTDEGRRIEEIDGGWTLINYQKYRKMASKEEQIEKATARTRRYRERRARNELSTDVYAPSTHVHAISTEAEAEADKKVITTDRIERVALSRPTPKGAQHGSRLPADWRASKVERDFAAGQGLDPDLTADTFRDYWHGVAGAKGRKVDWGATWRNWCRRDRTGPLAASAARKVQSPRGNDAFYEQLASIADRDRKGPSDTD